MRWNEPFLLVSFYSFGNWGLERLSDLFKVPQAVKRKKDLCPSVWLHKIFCGSVWLHLLAHGRCRWFQKELLQQGLKKGEEFSHREQEEWHSRWKTLPGQRQWAACWENESSFSPDYKFPRVRGCAVHQSSPTTELKCVAPSKQAINHGKKV